MAKVPYGVERLPKISIVCMSKAHERYRRQTDRRQTTDGRTMTYSEHELGFTFAKNYRTPAIICTGLEKAWCPECPISSLASDTQSSNERLLKHVRLKVAFRAQERLRLSIAGLRGPGSNLNWKAQLQPPPQYYGPFAYSSFVALSSFSM